MAITRVGTGTGGNGAATSVAVALPAGVKAGDVAIWEQYLESTAAITPQLGYNLAFRISNTTVSNAFDSAIYWKRLGWTETGNHTFTHSSAWTAAFLAVYRGCITTGSPIDFSLKALASTAAVTSQPAGPIFPSRDGIQVVAGFGFAGTLVGPTGMTDITNFSDLVYSELSPFKIRSAGTGTKAITGPSQTMNTIMFQLIDAQAERRRVSV